MKAPLIAHVRDAELCGTLFDKASKGIVSGVNTQFLVDHKEPLEALSFVREVWE